MDPQIINHFWLGLVQGLTEFLPVSSTGHLMLLETIFGIKDESIALEVLLHVGTLVAVFACFWRRIWNMICHPLKSELWLVVIATIPAVILKVALRDKDLFSIEYLGYSFLVTTLIFWLADLVAGVSFETKEVKWYNALVMGLMQAVAILPGISRSGSTISGGIASGLSRKRAADFSFLMSIPAICGGIVLEAKSIFSAEFLASSGGAVPLIVGVVTAAVSGFVAIKFMLAIIRRVRLPWFGLYTGVLGVLILLDQYVFHIYFK